jgi:hypothetical protein
MAGIGSSIGGTLGGIAGTMAGPLGTALGTAAGSMVGGALEAIPSLIKTDAEKENEKRLAALRRQQEMGTLGLTEAEKQSMYTAGTNQIGNRLQQAQAQSRAVGAAGMGTGAGAAQLQQAQLAEAQANLAAGVSQGVEAKNLERKRELEEEMQGRIATDSEYNQKRLQAGLGILSGGLAGGIESYKQEQTIQGRKPTAGEITAMANHLNLSTDDAAGLMSYIGNNPDAAKYLEILGGGKK